MLPPRSARRAARALSRRCCSPSQSITRAPASTRRTTAVARARACRRTVKAAARARRATRARRRRPPRRTPARATRRPPPRTESASQLAIADHAARRVGKPLRWGQRRRTPREHRDRGDVVLGAEDDGLPVGGARLTAEPAVERVLLVGTEVRPTELHDLAGGEVGREGLDDAASVERQLERLAERRHLAGRRLNDLLLAPG